MASSVKICARRSFREFLKDVTRSIAKTPAAPNSDALSRQETVNPALVPNKWMRLHRISNNRALSTIQTKVNPKSSVWTIVSKEESREFMAVFPDLVRDLTDAGRHTDIKEINKRYAKLLQYNVPSGKKSRGLAVVGAYKMFEHPDRLTPENIRLANILGWCVEMLSAMFVINTDLINQAEIRREAPCWYTKNDVGLMAVNDSVMLQGGMYAILRKYFSEHSCYLPIMELLHDVTLKSSMGHTLDRLCSSQGLEMFTMNKYDSIVKYRNAYLTFQLPVALAMYLANHTDAEMHRQAKTILLEMGHFYQVQDDFLDCFGDVSLTGKPSRYIQEGRCTWLAVVALQRASPSQKELLEECYGKSDPSCVEAVKTLYRQLGLPCTYTVFEESSYNLINTHIHQLTKGLPHKLFFRLMEKIYKRECCISAALDKTSPDVAPRDPSKIRILLEEEVEHFRSYFSVLIKDLTHTNLITDLAAVKYRLRKILEYNITTGKQIRPAIHIAAYKFILGKDKLSEDEFREASLIAWCIEMVSSYILMLDDIVDNSETRRGKTAWYKLENVGLKAINDATLIQMSVFKLLEKYFSTHSHYKDISQVFVDVMLKTSVGQVLDCQEWCFENSTPQMFNEIAYNKTGYYTFYFPLVTAMFLAKRTDLDLNREGLGIFMELGRFYQLQNDFLDVYGEAYSGKMGTDIQEGKYSWLIIKAIEKASPYQQEVLRNCYGRWNSDCVEQVKDIYDQLDLKSMFHEEVESIYRKIFDSASRMRSDIAKELMLGVARVCLGHEFYLKR
ncbi:uncharacterized protein LOC123307184 [Coccinella septempunctata]|uniref:uncharacterized protein LOC123307184 n=1 Tax=Coccinella septempunctata TaxID=41139 RepID=UPI001D086C7B|nr:uncharacterized protein LOC123307184 [Coccinella septempunctata]